MYLYQEEYNMTKTEQPLVSVPVVTYNSAKTILETLESIKAQTYPNIELIISDDCSTDNTVGICREWMGQNKERFSRVEILTVEKNTGISGNDNRAQKACRGEWVKGIAGDDILKSNCIEEFVAYIQLYPEAKYVFCQMEGFGRSKEEVDEYMNRCFDYSFFSLSPQEQYQRLLFKGNCIPAPALFYNLERAKKDAYYSDERIPMVDDYPKWIRLTRAGVNFSYLAKPLVKYRLSESSISTTTTPSLRANKSNKLIYIYYLFAPRFRYYKSPIKRLGEIRKYTHAANIAWGGWFWKTMMVFDKCLAKILNALGTNLKE